MNFKALATTLALILNFNTAGWWLIKNNITAQSLHHIILPELGKNSTPNPCMAPWHSVSRHRDIVAATLCYLGAPMLA